MSRLLLPLEFWTCKLMKVNCVIFPMYLKCTTDTCVPNMHLPLWISHSYSWIHHFDLNFGVNFMHTASGIRRGMEKMQRAFEFYPYCATSLNYLANHFFFTGQHFLVEQLTETALAVTNHGPTRAHSYYNLARSYHSKVCNI